ncbi:tripartite tricarboxylate transporter TctB family protein [Roseomonas sp. AR75]|uniref:tripartite tricarboxylate transporter TctB family protein n=1 Tax=Roseomonas sp. AR75 TaxID=2562311 RepID=UPI0014858421|nr:tripartite tricarboxylate transporter TctB family protein [Roseomonas sp. AR75]
MNTAAGRRDLLVGALAIGGGLIVVWLAAQIRGMPGQPFSPGFAPSITGGLAALVGAALVLRAAFGHAPALGEEDEAGGPPFRLAALWVGGGIIAIAVLLESLGFVPLLVVWLTGFLLLTGVRLLPALAFAMPMVLGMDLAFTKLLGVPLPPGDWLIDLGLLG